MTEQAPEKVDFSGLVAGLAGSAILVLNQVEILLDPSAAESREEGGEPLSGEDLRQRIADGLGGARQLIDTLSVLDEKTRGNLTDEEQELLRGTLSELRIRYVGLANRAIPERNEGKGEQE